MIDVDGRTHAGLRAALELCLPLNLALFQEKSKIKQVKWSAEWRLIQGGSVTDLAWHKERVTNNDQIQKVPDRGFV